MTWITRDDKTRTVRWLVQVDEICEVLGNVRGDGADRCAGFGMQQPDLSDAAAPTPASRRSAVLVVR